MHSRWMQERLITPESFQDGEECLKRFVQSHSTAQSSKSKAAEGWIVSVTRSNGEWQAYATIENQVKDAKVVPTSKALLRDAGGLVAFSVPLWRRQLLSAWLKLMARSIVPRAASCCWSDQFSVAAAILGLGQRSMMAGKSRAADLAVGDNPTAEGRTSKDWRPRGASLFWAWSTILWYNCSEGWNARVTDMYAAPACSCA
jgi:hypothetical protein